MAISFADAVVQVVRQASQSIQLQQLDMGLQLQLIFLQGTNCIPLEL